MRPSGAWPLLDQARLQALLDLGLTQASDPGMERYAQRVRDQIGVPVSLVSLVQADQQVFPGMCGLPDPWAERRATRLLGIAEALNTCRTVADLRRVLASFVDDSTGLFDATLHLATDGLPHLPTRAVAGSSGIVIAHDLSSDGEGLPASSVERLLGRGARAVGYLPVRSAAADLGVIELLWRRPRVLDQDEEAMASALSAYSSQALERALLLEDRISVAHQLQAAMLTEQPEGTGLDLAASYVPARAEERVGGDWYDALVLPRAAETGRSPVLVTVGDVTGHDISAAAVMGQLRAMLRQTASDHPDEQPSELLARLERSCVAFDLAATGTAVLARVAPLDEGRWQLVWTNAGHPPPVVVEPDGTARLLPEHDMMFGYSEMQTEPREDHTLDLSPGSAVVIYTDGITDSASVDPLRQTDRLVEVVRKHRGDGAQAMVDALRDAFVGMSDDVVTVVVAVP
ncbi:MAG: serine/threonine-protein phosphatase [Actinomycetales bacterium]|nr:MAG: serine/threonine-protein phosphatase [Actinomycetales bacterium]